MEAGGTTSTSSQVVGFKWLLARIATSSGVVAIPASYQATFQFTSDQRFLASDSVNAISGGYTQTQGGFSTRDWASTAEGNVGGDAVRVEVIEAMRAVTSGSVEVTSGSRSSEVVMAAAGYTLTFSKVGNATTFPPPTPTPTASR
jgi:hypothetical protein